MLLPQHRGRCSSAQQGDGQRRHPEQISPDVDPFCDAEPRRRLPSGKPATRQAGQCARPEDYRERRDRVQAPPLSIERSTQGYRRQNEEHEHTGENDVGEVARGIPRATQVHRRRYRADDPDSDQQAPDDAQGALLLSRCPDAHAEGNDEDPIGVEQRVDQLSRRSADRTQLADGLSGVAVVGWISQGRERVDPDIQ
jgi:hypothetical protein